MEMQPFDFCINAGPKELKSLSLFKHRTFSYTDLLYFVEFFRHHYKENKSFENAFTNWGADMESMLNGFYNYFFSLEDVPYRTRKHIANPAKGSTCKRLNMFLRWMVRNDQQVDFGIWTNINPAQLICPIDVHVGRVARNLKLLKRKQTDWQAALELTDALRKFDAKDPVKYDFALFSLGVKEAYK